MPPPLHSCVEITLATSSSLRWCHLSHLSFLTLISPHPPLHSYHGIISANYPLLHWYHLSHHFIPVLMSPQSPLHSFLDITSATASFLHLNHLSQLPIPTLILYRLSPQSLSFSPLASIFTPCIPHHSMFLHQPLPLLPSFPPTLPLCFTITR